MKSSTAYINKYALQYNLKKIKEIINTSKIIAIIKANAYGHGLLKTAKIINKFTDYFGVSRISEAIYIRNIYTSKQILLLNGFIDSHELNIVSELEIDTIVHSMEQIKILKNTKIKKKIKIWMKIDVGLCRFGVKKEQTNEFYNLLITCKNIKQPINFIGHFSHSNELKNYKITNSQFNLFNNFTKNKKGKKTIASSSAILFYPFSHLDYVRPGIIMYGIYPNKDKKIKNLNLLPVMTLKSRLISIKKHKTNNTIGYNGNWTSKNNTNIGLISIGYGDGYPSNAPTGTPVIINGRRVSIIGKVYMDTITIDLGLNNTDKIGDEVIMWGKELPIEEISAYTNVNTYALLSNLTNRIKIQ